MPPSRSEAGQPSGADIRQFLPVVKRPKFQRVDLQAARSGKVAKKPNGRQVLNRVSTEMVVEGGAVEEEETSAEDRLLEVFDLDSTYGPTVGIKRLQRWERARRLGLNPSMERRKRSRREVDKRAGCLPCDLLAFEHPAMTPQLPNLSRHPGRFLPSPCADPYMSTNRRRKRERSKGFPLFTLFLKSDSREAVRVRAELEDPLILDRHDSHFSAALLQYVGKGYAHTPSSQELLNDYLSWFYKQPPEKRPESVVRANTKREEALRDSSWIRYLAVKEILLNPGHETTRQRTRSIVSSIPTYTAISHDEEHEYPPRDVWLYDSQEAADKWRKKITRGRLPDKRKKRKPMHKVKLDQLLHNVKEGDSARFVDENGALVFLVIRNFCPSQRIQEWADSVAHRNVDDRKCIRLEDAGSIVMSGWSAGSRSSPQFHWTRNLSKKVTPVEAEDLAYEASSSFAVFWNLSRCILPAQIIDDFDSFIEDSGIYRMDSGILGAGAPAQYTIPTEEGWATFRHAKMAPPCGVFARNYARATHNESQPHTWAISWTTGRKGKVSDGGHFYNCCYRLRVEGAANTLVAWQPKDFHATSLQNVCPNDPKPTFVQSGLAIVTSSRIDGVFKQYMDGQMSATEVVEECFKDGYQDDEECGSQ
ncbi:hypothetical protein VNI00_004719 [Paramarasmius palmivorus]|uniref:DNA polymerase delta subunit 4 n=1 Tax=Paramarasmius palmivorus TaxID=297713 RepID=A0AAW0DEV8_9AGAR